MVMLVFLIVAVLMAGIVIAGVCILGYYIYQQREEKKYEKERDYEE